MHTYGHAVPVYIHQRVSRGTKLTMSSITVLKSSPAIIVPSEAEPVAVAPKAGEKASLSSFDKRAGPFPVTMLLAYDRPIHEPVETIRRSLSRALSHYQPMAGRLLSDADAIACTGEGARASCALEELLDDGNNGGAARRGSSRTSPSATPASPAATPTPCCSCR